MHELEQKILTFVRMNGPVLPVQISKNIGRDIMYAGAILSSLAASKQILITNAKIGGSPLYYVRGQESKLQILGQHLKEREGEAFELLKRSLILRDSEVGPVNRIALREIKDFAFPITVNNNNQEEIFWRWYLISDDDAKDRISKLFEPKKIEELIKEKSKEIPFLRLDKKDSFIEYVEDYLKTNKIEVLSSELIRKGKEINMIVKLPTSIGELKFFLKAKDKKSISNADLALAHNEGQQKNLPVIVLSGGNAAKKANLFIEKNLKNQLIFKKIEQ